MATEEPRKKRRKVDQRDLVAAVGGDALLEVAERYGCGPVQFSGTADALYERHLIFDNVVAVDGRRPARALRGGRALGARRAVAALDLHRADLRAREPQARLLPLDGVPASAARSRTTSRTCCSTRSWCSASRRRSSSIGSSCSSRNPTPASATAGSAASPPASSTRWRRCSSRPWATGCATSTGSSGRRSRTAGSTSSRTTGCAVPIRGRSRAAASRSRWARTARSRCATGACEPIPGRPSSLIGIPVRSARRRLRRQDDQHAAAVGGGGADYFDFQRVQPRRVRRGAGRARSRPSR